MAKVTKEEIRKIAHLSRITITDIELDQLSGHIAQVLEYARRVNRAANQVEATIPFTANVMRPDAVISSDPVPLLAQVPAREADYIVVPAVLET